MKQQLKNSKTGRRIVAPRVFPWEKSAQEIEDEKAAEEAAEAENRAAIQADIAALHYIESRPLATPETISTLARILREVLEETTDPQS